MLNLIKRKSRPQTEKSGSENYSGTKPLVEGSNPSGSTNLKIRKKIMPTPISRTLHSLFMGDKISTAALTSGIDFLQDLLNKISELKDPSFNLIQNDLRNKLHHLQDIKSWRKV